MKNEVPPKEEKMAASLFRGLPNGGTMCFDLGVLSHHPSMKHDYFLKEEWFPKIHNKNKFLDYDHLADVVGPKYQPIVEEIIGKDKVLYDGDAMYILYVAKTDKIPKWAEGRFTFLKVAWY